jgi:citrate lyase subunit beta/citryl-CoA lyase
MIMVRSGHMAIRGPSHSSIGSKIFDHGKCTLKGSDSSVEREMKEPFMRSHLLVRADDAAKLERALESQADCLWLDLEDLPGAARPRARELALGLLRSVRGRSAPHLFVRVNGLESGDIDADLDVVMQGAPDGIVLPKAHGGADVQHLGTKLALREAEYDLIDGSTRIMAIAAETPAAIFKMGTYPGASRRLAGLCWAPNDLAAAIGAKAPDGALTAPYALARSLTLMAAKAAGVAAIDCAYANRRDIAGLKAECEAARRDGFTGKLAIDADQVAVIGAAFA